MRGKNFPVIDRTEGQDDGQALCRDENRFDFGFICVVFLAFSMKICNFVPNF